MVPSKVALFMPDAGVYQFVFSYDNHPDTKLRFEISPQGLVIKMEASRSFFLTVPGEVMATRNGYELVLKTLRTILSLPNEDMHPMADLAISFVVNVIGSQLGFEKSDEADKSENKEEAGRKATTDWLPPFSDN